MRVTHTSTVTEDQIDHLGHMNVRYYAVNALAGTRAMIAALPGGGADLLVHDMYTRHLNEQLLGSPLVVRSAFLAASERGVRIHHELANADTGALAATFVHGVRAALPPEAVAAAAAEVVPHPAHAPTRSIALEVDLLDTPPSLDTVRDRGLAMRKERRVSEAECEADGSYRLDLAPMLTWGGEPTEDHDFEPIHETPEGIRMGWASMETRIQIGTLPRLGARIQPFGATVAVHDKVTHHVYWTYDVDSGALLTGFEVVSLAFDIAGRRAMSIPERARQRELERYHPDLSPQALA